MNIILMLNTDTLYEKAITENIPFFKVSSLLLLMIIVVLMG